MFFTHQSRFIVRNNTTGDVQLIGEKDITEKDHGEFSVLFKIVPIHHSNRFEIKSYKEESDMLGFVLRRTKDKEGYRLKRGDIMKLGRMRIKLKDYQIDNALNDEDKISKEVAEGSVEVKTFNDIPKDENDVCRICFSPSNDDANPLISACKCTGTMKFIHYQCLKAWLNLKLVIKEAPSICSYFWKSFECEICKSSYPYSILHAENRYSLINVKKPKTGSFIMLESLDHEKNTSRMIHIMTPTASLGKFKLGRGHESDIRVTDISVSRVHVIINCNKKGIFVEDNGSKFGTLILKSRIEVGPISERKIQVGRTLISFEVKPQKPTK